MAEQKPKMPNLKESAQSTESSPKLESSSHKPSILDVPSQVVNYERLPDEGEYQNDGDDEDDEYGKNDEDDYPTVAQVGQPSDFSTVSIEFFEDTSRGATLRTRNEPSDQKQRSIVTSRGAKSLRYKSTVSLTTVVHGFIDADATPRIPATLIVLDYRLKNGTYYASVYTELEFSNTTPGSPKQEPFVRAFAPFEETGFDQETWKEEHIKTSYKISGLEVGAAGGKGRIDGGLGQERERTEKKRFFRLFQAGYSSIKDGMDGFDTVWWDMRQNKDTKEGITPHFTTAVLLQRSDETSPFSAKFLMALETGWWAQTKNRIDKWFGVSKDDPLLFDPTLEDKGCPVNVDKNKLGKLMLTGLGGYKQMVNFGKKSA